MRPAVAAVALALHAQTLLAGEPTDQPPFAVTRRELWIDGGTCHVSYTLQWLGREPVTLLAGALRITYRGTLSNAACPAHVTPVSVRGELQPQRQPRAILPVREGRSEKDRCREQIVVKVGRSSETLELAKDSGDLTLRRSERAVVNISFRHDHFLYGPHDPLLGPREVTIRWGPITVTDRVVFESGHQLRRPRRLVLEPSRARQDPEYYHSPPGSLYLAADLPGYQYYRFEDVAVRYDSEWLLRFRYTIARGTMADCRVRVVEYQESPRYWRRLGGGFDQRLQAGGQWRLFQRRFRVGPETTAIAVDFRMTGSDVGEMWVDDVELVPVACADEQP